VLNFNGGKNKIILEKTRALFFSPDNGNLIQNINQTDLAGFRLTMLLAIIIAISLGILWISIVQTCPSVAPYLAYILLTLLLVGTGLFFLLSKNL